MKEQFIKFLKENDVYPMYVDQFEKQSMNDCTLDEFLNQTPPSLYLLHAFKWDILVFKGEEDINLAAVVFWSRVSMQWLMILKKERPEQTKQEMVSAGYETIYKGLMQLYGHEISAETPEKDYVELHEQLIKNINSDAAKN